MIASVYISEHDKNGFGIGLLDGQNRWCVFVCDMGLEHTKPVAWFEDEAFAKALMHWMNRNVHAYKRKAG